ncbi:hypothetical protein ATK30_0485 [Amycolatopsis echigonensis]|uniref:Uncharacterized protein n=1 Tax=Amycolatopsis echigonensis TaxID=2576905 RepID=A0A2N3X069_9PSEU|nr:hypothetical protein ATK30_0485 [Amycolatopsis niigatensis]
MKPGFRPGPPQLRRMPVRCPVRPRVCPSPPLAYRCHPASSPATGSVPQHTGTRPDQARLRGPPLLTDARPRQVRRRSPLSTPTYRHPARVMLGCDIRHCPTPAPARRQVEAQVNQARRAPVPASHQPPDRSAADPCHHRLPDQTPNLVRLHTSLPDHNRRTAQLSPPRPDAQHHKIAALPARPQRPDPVGPTRRSRCPGCTNRRPLTAPDRFPAQCVPEPSRAVAFRPRRTANPTNGS